jgi:hypothetical protein
MNMGRVKSDGWQAATVKEAAVFFGVTEMGLMKWIKEGGAPRNSDGRCNLSHIHMWLLEREKKRNEEKDSLKDQKLQKEIEWKEAQINKINSEYVDRGTYNEHIRALVVAVNKHGEEMARKNYPEFIGLNADEAKIKLIEIFKFRSDLLAGKNV